LENGVTLCDPSKSGAPLAHGCHYKAEEVLAKLAIAATEDEQKKAASLWPGEQFTPHALYKAVGSSYAQAVEASMYLK
jgi:hypothetical protein